MLVAHDRKEYILEAMKSLASQTLRRDEFEVVVVKNYQDIEIDEYAKANSFVSIFTEVENVGAKMSLGVEEANGEVISFLEDDDIFEPEKLDMVKHYFEKNDSLGILFNNHMVINGRGAVLNVATPNRTKVLLGRSKEFVAQCTRNHLKSLDLGFSSCISIRKDVLVPHLKHLNKIRFAPDFFMILSYFESTCNGIYLPNLLTRYRLHYSQSNRIGDFDTFLLSNRELRAGWVQDYKTMGEWATTNAGITLVSSLITYNKLFVLMIDHGRRFLSKGRMAIKLISNVKILKFLGGSQLLLISVLSVISPVLAHRIYYDVRRERISENQEN